MVPVILAYGRQALANVDRAAQRKSAAMRRLNQAHGANDGAGRKPAP